MKNARKPRAAAAHLRPQAEERSGTLIGYARVSTLEQSLDLQVDALKAAGVAAENIHVERVSGVSRKRPALEAAVLGAKRGDVLVAWKLDRVARSLFDLLTLLRNMQERGIELRTISGGIDTTTPAGRLMINIMGTLAEFERDLIVERTRAGMDAFRKRGGRVGRERKIKDKDVPEIRRMHAEGASVAEIARRYKVSHETIRARALRDQKQDN